MPRPTWRSPRRSPHISPGRVRLSGSTAWPRNRTTYAPRWTGRSGRERCSSRSGTPVRCGASGKAAAMLRKAGPLCSASSRCPAPTRRRRPGSRCSTEREVLPGGRGTSRPLMASMKSRLSWLAASVTSAASPTGCSTSATRGSWAATRPPAKRSAPRRSICSRRSATRAARHGSAGSPRTSSP